MATRLSTGFVNQMMGITTEMITNGAFTSDTTGWTAATATLTSESSGQSGNCLQIAETGGAAAGQAYQDLTTKVGHVYKLTAYFKKGTADGGRILVGTTSDNDAIFASRALSDATWTQHIVYFIATATTTRITLESTDATVGETSLFDTVTCDCADAGFKEIFKDCFIDVYTGTQPTLANDAPTGTRLVTFYSDGSTAGLEWDDSVAGVISKATAETWTGTAAATGTAGWFRIRQASDSGASSTTEPRVDGVCTISGGQLNMSSLSIVSGAVQTISTFTITMPVS